MKLQVAEQQIIVGKRVTIGAAINGILAAVAHYRPDDAAALLALSVPLTFVIQVVIGNTLTITTKE